MIKIDTEKIRIFCDEHTAPDTPIVIIHTFQNEGEKVLTEYKRLCGRSIILTAVQADNWNEMLSPWKTKAVFKGSGDFGCGADEHIKELEKLLYGIKEQKRISSGKCVIAGYSFAGLFALYSLYKTDAFDCAVSASGSLWFPALKEYIFKSSFAGPIDKIYLSLGDKESKTKNPVMSTVEQSTKDIYEYYSSQGITCTFEMNSGGHFNDTEKRLAKGILSVL